MCVYVFVRDDGGGGGKNVVLFTQLALSLEIGFSNTKFDRIGIEMRNKNIKLHAPQYIRSIHMHAYPGWI